MSELRRRTIRPSRDAERATKYEEYHSLKDKSWNLSPWSLLVFIVLFTAFLMSAGLHFSNRLPAPPKITENSSDFNAGNALKYLEILSKGEPRITGSYENEFRAVQSIVEIIRHIMDKKTSSHEIIFNLQKASGEFHLDFLNINVDLVYRNVQNIVVKIGPKTPPSNRSILVNCHFDSVFEGPGASDDGLNCAVMLEILRGLAVSKEPLKHNVIFLFNGAEESPLLASHGFITQHKWADEVKAFLNLESCGAGGPEVLFQAGANDPWLIKLYAKAAQYPAGLVVAEELFQSGLIPSDTDFRIFRDFGGKPGLDFAHGKNGYVYHTIYDNIDHIDNVFGVIQHTGSNIYSLIKTILGSKEFENPEKLKPGKQVYYDLFGLIFVHYSVDFGKALNSVAVILAIAGYYATAYYGHSYTILRSFCPLSSTIMYATILISFIYNLSLAYFLNKFGLTMSWYTNSLIIIPLYSIPTLVILMINVILYERYDKSKSHTNLKLKSQSLSVLLFWTTILFLSTFFNARSSFLLMVLVLLPAFYTFVTGFIRPASTSFSWIVFFILTTIPSSLYFSYLAILTFRLFIPITGRSGFEKNPEIIIGVLSTLFSAAIFSYVSGLILAVRRHWLVMSALIIAHLSTILAVAFVPSLFPFSTETPQRIMLTHSNRQFFDVDGALKHQDALFWVQNIDRRGKSSLPFLKNAPTINDICEKNGHCGLPWYGKFRERSASSIFESAPHNVSDDILLKLNKKINLSGNVVHLSFNITGPDHMGVILTPIQPATLKSWSLPGRVTNQSSYIIGYVHGLDSSGWNLDIDIMADSRNLPKVDAIMVGCFFKNNPDFYAAELRNVKTAMSAYYINVSTIFNPASRLSLLKTPLLSSSGT